eukprot:1098822_1
MTFGNALGGTSNTLSSLPGLSNMSNMSNMNNMSHNMSSMSPATHLGGYGIHTSPGMTYVSTHQQPYVPPMSPATQSINSSLSSLDPQAQKYALMSGSNNAKVGYGTMFHQHNQLGLNQPQIINNINRWK